VSSTFNNQQTTNTMSSLYARGNAIVPFTPSASQEDMEGYLVDLAGDTATISSSASVPAKGVILEGQETTGVSSIGILGGIAAPVRLRAGGTIAKGAEIQQNTDGTLITDAGSGARLIVGVALEAAVAGQLFDAVTHTPIARS
jgi:hypothetical protein